MTRTTGYAGIDKRFVASLIDGIILSIVGFIIVGRSPGDLKQLDAQTVVYLILIQMLTWVYFAVLESSSMQGTFGKRVLGIIVTNTQGNKISFGKATGRFLAKSICLLFWILAALVAAMAPSKAGNESPYVYVFIALVVIGFVVGIFGYLMAGYTEEKQALHDIIARCYVVNGRGQSSSISWKPIVVLAIAVLVSKGIFSQVPATPSPTPTPSPSPTPTPSPSPSSSPSLSPSPEPPTISSIFGELTPASSALYGITNGVYELEFAAGVIQHQATLSMSGDSGIMEVRLPNEQGGTQTIKQTMKLWQSSKGLVIAGENPIDQNTKKPSDTYVTDNFLIAVSPGKKVFQNISVNSDGKTVDSPVNATFKGYPGIGIRMSELSSQVRDEINQKGSLPFSITQDTGVIIIEVMNGEPAAKAGLRPGDIIRSINGNTITLASEVQSQIKSSLLFSPLNFEINRNGEKLSGEVVPECCVTPEESTPTN
ncbi:RDD family protein [Microcoleus sp.]|uniref:RDD family protein n=1 Tax=Microcoleus sp. TaxID=44472 RepID=UPI003524EE8A